jgi:hypothetical protein
MEIELGSPTGFSPPIHRSLEAESDDEDDEDGESGAELERDSF